MASIGKIIVISAPSGCGKSTIINEMGKRGIIQFEFSVSATNRPPRDGEEHGKNYWFLSEQEFKDAINNDEFVEYEEVYPGRFYGTLKKEITDKCAQGKNIILDIDVKGGLNVKKIFPKQALTIFIAPPSIEELKNRLINRGTENNESLAQRLGKAQYEMTFAPLYDVTVINDNLEKAIEETEEIIKKFIET